MTVLARERDSEGGATSSTGSTLLDTVLRFRALGLLVVLAALVAVTAAVNPRFLSGSSIRDILLAASITLLLATGMTVVVLTRGIDLSVGSVLGLSAFCTAWLLSENPGVSIPVAMLVGLGIGAVCGLFNGSVVHFGRVPPLVATLGTLYVFRGVVYFVAGGSRINASDMPAGFLDFGSARVLGVPYLILISLVVLALVAVFLSRYRAGRDMYALGSSPEAAELAGIPAGRRKLTAYVLCGALAGLGGVLYAARYGTVDASAGYAMELDIVAAVVVGGVAIFGGSGSVLGAALGAFLLTVISNALPVLNIDQFWQRAIVGALIVGAIAVDRLVALRVAESLRKKGSHVG
ncbi:ABC transporter permease [Actinobacteria bacterium YIM 96077]|uniref:Autoinducer 2 import system permease protein LsrC n=1 Tax=Phytoactinopolyspora halophila TaxID=1981511 RepID=A0A329QJJ6_9ACTN|nr:ABC transporter permease [Phytoactinopolyspora halophila]AYY12617.1 ABC transporter permease [Actinobacteria bacterium YIM 96077]RAW12480.1 ABC transporter permease [Phytoactinopolyspora halophila]